MTDADGNVLVLQASEDGIYAVGSYYDYLVGVVEESLNNFLVDTEFPYTETAGGFMGGGPPDDGIQRDEDGAPDAETNTATITNIADFVTYGSKIPNKKVLLHSMLSIAENQ